MAKKPQSEGFGQELEEMVSPLSYQRTSGPTPDRPCTTLPEYGDGIEVGGNKAGKELMPIGNPLKLGGGS